MSYGHVFQPLNAIADSYLMESVQKTLQHSSLNLLKSTLHRYIDNKISFEDISFSLSNPTQKVQFMVAEPQGLYLKEVKY